MTKAVQLNGSGNLETTSVLPLVSLRPEPFYKEITRTDGVITRISTYVSNGGVELYRKQINRSGGVIASITETDYTRNPAVVRTKTITRTSGAITAVGVA
jgi:hypothetical protein